MARIAWRLAGILALAAASAVAFLVISSDPASAACSYFDEDAMRTEPSCRPFIADPGVNNFLTRAELASAPRQTVYAAFGFDKQWMWYAPAVTKTLSDGGPSWAGCTVFVGPGGTCAPSQVVFQDAALGFIQNPVTIHALEFGGGFLGLVCGNFSETRPRPPIPTIEGVKFHDLNGDGVRQPGEPPLAGVQFELHRITTQASQSSGHVSTVTTNAAGEFVFRLDGAYPGVYEVREVVPTGWAPTTATTQQVTVNPGIGEATLDGGTYGNIGQTDVAKTSFEIVNPPATLEARQTATVTVRSVIANLGPNPRPVTVQEQLAVSGPADCVIDTQPAVVQRTIPAFGSVTIDQAVAITCDLPSSHLFRFDNDVEIVSAGFEDVDPDNNDRTFEWEVPVLAHADLAVTELTLACLDEALVDVAFPCVAEGTIANLGPYGPVEADVQASIQPASDCSAEVVTAAASRVWLDAGETAPIRQEWSVTCTLRSDHHHDAAASIAAVDEHVVDAGGNNDATTDDDNEVFEFAELEALDARILCTELWDGDPFICTLDVDVTNHGPGTAVAVAISGELTGSSDCSTVPSRLQTVPDNLDAGEQVTITFTWQVDCTEPVSHVFTAFGRIEQAEPHVIDDPQNNEVKIVWLPIDFKPLSDPNTVNVRRGGLTSVALLGTPDFDPFAEVVVESLRFGPGAAEAVRCADEPEDLNGDGIGDMTCKFRNADIGWHPGQELVFLTGELADGCEFMAADRVRVLTR